MIASQRKQAEEERAALLADTHTKLEQERADWDVHLAQERRNYIAQLHKSGAASLVSLARKALHDLADETLEQRIVTHVLAHLRPMTEDLRKAADNKTPAVVTTRDALPDGIQTKLAADLEKLIPGVRVQFATNPAQATGLMLQMGAVHVAWTVDSYFEALDTMLSEQIVRDPVVKVDSNGQ